MKLIAYIFSFILCLPLYAQHDATILKVHATILPKIVFMDSSFQDKIYKNTILIALICDKNHYNDALEFKELINEKYENGINGYSIKIEIISDASEKKVFSKKTIYYLFPSTPKKTISVINNLKNSKAILFSFDKNDLFYGSNISLSIGKRIKPILNMSSLRKKNISMQSSLIDISEIYFKRKLND